MPILEVKDFRKSFGKKLFLIGNGTVGAGDLIAMPESSGMKKHFPTYIHESCSCFSHIYVSAGIRGLQIKIAPQDLIKEAKGEICSLVDE